MDATADVRRHATAERDDEVELRASVDARIRAVRAKDVEGLMSGYAREVVTFDIVAPGNAYIGGVIAPGLEAMTNFLYDRTALLPRISLREPRSAIGKSTNQAMLAGAIFGYRGLIREILRRIIEEKSWSGQVRIVATGGYAKLIARKLPEVDIVNENLTLEGLRLVGRMNTEL